MWAAKKSNSERRKRQIILQKGLQVSYYRELVWCLRRPQYGGWFTGPMGETRWLRPYFINYIRTVKWT